MHFDLDKIKTEFIKYAPAYAMNEAAVAFDKVFELQMQKVLRNGLYYVVLVDIEGSTKYAQEKGNIALADKIKYFVTSTFTALGNAKLENLALYIKEIGDAVLLIFAHFPDILRWNNSLLEWLSIRKDYNFNIRTCINVGEVYLEGVYPLSLAVSQTFKMEKLVKAGEIVLTEPAYLTAWPTLARAHYGFEFRGEYTKN
jgi:class 3 adenylate cyclase